MLTGLYFGSFNPIHIGHLAIANYMLEYTNLDELWFVISPHNPLKQKSSLLNDYNRLEMVELAIEGYSRFRTCDVEFRMPQPSYTIDTLTYLTESYPKREFALIMGSDGLATFSKWKNYLEIVNNFTRYVYPRNEKDVEKYASEKNLIFVNAPKMEISSSFVREAIKQGKDIRYFLPHRVYDLIEKYSYYK